jgi:bacterioferritin-associated ferredoxin
MNIKTDKKLIREAIASGCTTAAELAHYLKVRALIAHSFHSI